MYYNSNCKGRLAQLLKSCRSYKDKASCRNQHPVIYGWVFSFREGGKYDDLENCACLSERKNAIEVG